MLTDDVQLISVDDHVIEPPHVWETYLPEKYREQGPRIVETDDGKQAWAFDGDLHPLNFQGNAATRKLKGDEDGQPSLWAHRYDDMIPAAYDVHERVGAMDEDGITASLLFPTFPRFAGTRFLHVEDRDLALACIRAYNDWQHDEWVSEYPDRFIFQFLVPIWDVEEAAREIERNAARGGRSVAFCENPAPLGLPSFPTGHWDPVFRAAEETEVVLSMHIGTSGSLPRPSKDSVDSVGIALCGVNAMLALADLTFSGQLTKFPDLKFALSEGGAGWVPYVLERLDYTWERSRYEGIDHDAPPPTELYERHFWTCFIADRVAIETRHLIGVDKLMWEADFPHNDSNWPNSRKLLAEVTVDVPDDEVARIGELNARELYRFPRP